MQQELVTEGIDRMDHKTKNLWNFSQFVTGNPLSFFFLDTEPAANNCDMYHVEYLQNMRVDTETPRQ
jgi:hypothetical protein